jgi:VanZ family protein
MRLKKIFLGVFIIFWLIVIFIFSNQNASKSENMSDKFSSSIIDITLKIKNEKISEETRKEKIENTRFLVRKTAHFTIYLILGILVYQACVLYGIKRKFLISILFCIIYASTDEIHQIFIVGRTAKLLDVFIDSFGSLIGISIIKKIKERS